MKLILTTILATLALQNASAQDFSVGIRTGLGKTMDVSRISAGTIDNTWDKELFVRYQTKRRLAFEVGGTQYNYQRAGIWHNSGCIVNYEPLYFSAPTSENLITTTNVNMLDLSLGVQYDISCNALKDKCPLMKNLSSFIGANVIGKMANVETRSVDKRISDGQINETEYKDFGIQDIYLGLNHTLTYNIKRVYITSVVGYSISTAIFQRRMTSNDWPIGSRLSLRIGVGYTL